VLLVVDVLAIMTEKRRCKVNPTQKICLELKSLLSTQNASPHRHLGASASMGTDIPDYLEFYNLKVAVALDGIFKGPTDI
jgi:hypothetical protein